MAQNFEVFVLVDSTGDYAVGTSEQQARDRYEEDIQAVSECDGFRIVKLNLAIPLPRIVEMAGSVPVDGPPEALIVQS